MEIIYNVQDTHCIPPPEAASAAVPVDEIDQNIEDEICELSLKCPCCNEGFASYRQLVPHFRLRDRLVSRIHALTRNNQCM